MKDFNCSYCSQVHKIFFEAEFGLPKVIVNELDSGELSCESTDRWFIVQNKYFFIRGLLTLPIEDLKEAFNWLVWIMVKKNDFLAFVNLLEKNEKSRWSCRGSLAAEFNFLGESMGIKVFLEYNESNNFPIVKVCEDEGELFNLQVHSVKKKSIIYIMELLYH